MYVVSIIAGTLLVAAVMNYIRSRSKKKVEIHNI